MWYMENVVGWMLCIIVIVWYFLLISTVCVMKRDSHRSATFGMFASLGQTGENKLLSTQQHMLRIICLQEHL